MKNFCNITMSNLITALLLISILSMASVSPVSALPTVGSNVDITSNSYNQNEPHIAINPTDSNKLVVGYNDYRNMAIYYLYYPQVGWSYSDDGGATWSFGADINLAHYKYTGDPVVAFESGGSNAYLAGLAWNDNGNGVNTDGSIWIAKSTDGGHSFGTPAIVAAGSGTTSTYLDKPWLYVNPSNNHVYLAWTKIVNKGSSSEERTIWFTRSTDGGLSFSAPIKVSDLTPETGTGRSHAAQITSKGTNVYVSWKTIEGTGRGTSAFQSPKIYIVGSTDDGVSFGASNLVTSFQQGIFKIFDSMDVNPSSGRIYITYADTPTYPTLDYNVYVASAASVSGPWTSVRVDDSSGVSDQSWPALDVAPNGRVDIIWYDGRSNIGTDVYYSSSTDGGATWETNTKITDTNWGWPSVFAGDYIAIASTNTKAHAAWMDNRGSNPGALPEIYTATLTMPALSLSSISGMKFNDLNGNGANDAEPGLQGWTIMLSNQSGIVKTITTDNNGNYNFTNLSADNYTVGEVLQAGWTQTAPQLVPPGTYTVNLTAGENVVGKDFGNFQLGTISGQKFNDVNGNGVKDLGDNGLAGWTITLTDSNGNKNTAITDASGNYKFDNLTIDTYTVGEVMPSGWIQTAPAVSVTGSATHTATISASGQNVPDQDFGNFKLGEVHGMKFEDLNANGIKDNTNFISETGLAGWNITINGTDTITKTTVNMTVTTDANGNYQFTGLTAGTYTITETPQNGWVQTAPSGGSYTVTIISGTVMKGQDFGNFHKGKITGGGWINITGDPKATFGIVGQYPDSKSAAQGNVEYQDHIANLNIKSIQINTSATTLDRKKGVITGLAQVNGKGSYPFVVYVEDNAEPGKGIDVFKIYLPTYPYSNGAILSGGNIQIHS